MNTFTVGQTVTRRGTESHGLIVDVYTHNGAQMVKVFHSRKTPPYTYRASELDLYIVQSPDTVLLMDDHGGLWAFEVLDVSADGATLYLMGTDGAYETAPLSEVTRIIPAPIAKLMRLYGDVS